MDCCLNECISWPCPDFDCFKCLTPGVTIDQVTKILDEVNSTVSSCINSKYTGCECYAELRICRPCRCINTCDSCVVDKIDLKSIFDHPIHELVEVKINGVPVDSSDWEIRECRYLVCPPCGWPLQVMSSPAGAECTWSFTVRYGTAPPPGLMRMRDKYFWELLAECFGKVTCSKENVRKITVKGVTYDLEGTTDILSKIRGSYRSRMLHRLDDWGASPYQYEYEVLDQWSSSSCDLSECIGDWVQSQIEAASNKTVEACGQLYDKYGMPV